MSGPKVVRIVTAEEIAQAHLRRLDAAFERWKAQASVLGNLDDAAYTAQIERHERLHGLFDTKKFDELSRKVPAEIEFLSRDLAEREERAIQRRMEERAALNRKEDRRYREHAIALFEALRERPETDVETLRHLEALASGDAHVDSRTWLARGFALLSAIAGTPGLSETQRALAARLASGMELFTLDAWRMDSGMSGDPRMEAIERQLTELELLHGEDVASPFRQQWRAVLEAQADRQDPLLDTLALELGRTLRARRHWRELSGRLRELVQEMNLYRAHENAPELLARATAIEAGGYRETAEISASIQECEAWVDARRKEEASQACRESMLSELASLGYEVHDGMMTAWASTGRVVLKKTATPGYGLEIGGKADRLQFRVVSFDRRNKARDLDVETIWCSEFSGLKERLRSQGYLVEVERALEVGAVPVKMLTETHDESHRRESVRKLRDQGV